MFIYLVGFFLSIFFAFLSEQSFKNGKKGIGIIFILFSLIPLCLIAGLRSSMVGTDVEWYAIPEFENAKDYSNFFKYITTNDKLIEISYLFVNFCCSKISEDIGVLLFILQLFALIPIYLVAYKNRHVTPLWVPILIYCFLFFNLSLCLMRQVISCSILLLAYYELEDKKYFKFSLLCILAVTFHTSSSLAILLLIAIYFVRKVKYKKTGMLLFILLLLALALSINIILPQLVGYSPLFSKYSETLANYDETYSFSIFERVLMLIIVMLPISNKWKLNNFNESIKYISIISFFLFLFLFRITYLIRFVVYFQYFIILSLPLFSYKRMYYDSQKNGYYSYSFIDVFKIFSIVLVIVSYWYVIYIEWGWYETNIYLFK